MASIRMCVAMFGSVRPGEPLWPNGRVPLQGEVGKYEPVRPSRDQHNLDTREKAADAKRKSLLQAIYQRERQEAGEAVPEADNYIDPNIVATQCDYGARTTRTGKKAESELDDGLGSPASNLDSCSVRGEDRIDNGQSSREPHQGSESRRDADHDCDGITYADFIHHVRTKQQIFKAQLIAVTNMPSTEYFRQVRAKQQMTKAQPAAASDSPQQEEPLARADPYGTVTTRTVQSIKKSMGRKPTRRQRATFYPEEDG